MYKKFVKQSGKEAEQMHYSLEPSNFTVCPVRQQVLIKCLISMWNQVMFLVIAELEIAFERVQWRRARPIGSIFKPPAGMSRFSMYPGYP